MNQNQTTKISNAGKQAKIPDSLRAKEISDMKFGMFICWSFSTFYGQEWTPTLDKDASFFKATGCDTDQWCKVAKDAGMGYILFRNITTGFVCGIQKQPKKRLQTARLVSMSLQNLGNHVTNTG